MPAARSMSFGGRAMVGREEAGMKKLVLVVLGAAAFAGCGGEDRAAELRDCMAGFEEGFESASPEAQTAVPRSAVEESARRLCERAIDQNVVSEDDTEAEVRDKLAALVEDNPDVLYPICIGSALTGFAELTPAEQSPALRAEFQSFGKRYCDVVIREGLFSLGRAPTTEEIERVFQENPEIVAPLCVAGGMQGYESAPIIIQGKKVSREKAKRYLSLVCTEAVSRRLLSITGEELTAEEQQSLNAIAVRIRRELVARGELP